MALFATHNDSKFGVGDEVRVVQKIQDGEKSRTQVFPGTVMGIKGRGVNKMFTVRRIGAQNIGIERIFPLASPTIEKIEVVKSGTVGVKHSKLYYIREKSAREIEKIYARARMKNQKQTGVKTKAKKKKNAQRKKR